MASVAVPSKTLVLLLFIHCLLLLILFVCGGVLVGLCFVLQYFGSFLVLQSSRWKKEPIALLFVMF